MLNMQKVTYMLLQVRAAVNAMDKEKNKGIKNQGLNCGSL